MTGLDILLVEDDPVEAMDIKKSVETLGHCVTSVSNQDHNNIKKKLNSDPDLILLDIPLEDDSNHVEIEYIEKLNTPVVFIIDDYIKTAFLEAYSNSLFLTPQESLTKENSLDSSYCYLSKPFSINELHFAIEIVVYKQKMDHNLKEAQESCIIPSENDLLNKIIQFSPTPLWIADEHGELNGINPSCCDLLKTEPEKVIGKYNILEDEFIKEQGHMNQVKSVFREGKRVNFNIKHEISKPDQIPPKYPDFLILKVNLFPIADEEGNVKSVLVQYHDVTQEKKAEKSQKKIKKALKDSEQRLSEIIDFLPDATFAIDKHGRVIIWNQAMEKMTGVPSDEIIGKGNYEYSRPFYGIRRPILIDLVHESDKEIEKNYYFVKKEGKTILAETEANLKDELRTLWGKVVPLYDSKGNINGAIEAIRDITESKKAFTSVKGEFNFLQYLIDTIPSPLFYKDTDHVYKGCNTAFEELAGLKKDEIIGKTVHEVFSEELATVLHESDSKLLKNQGLDVYEAEVEYADGSEHTMLFNKTTFQDPHGKIEGLIGVMVDISQLKKAEKSLQISESLYRTIFENKGTCTIIFDDNFTIKMVNSEMERLSGYPREELEGETWTKFIHPEDLPKMVNFHQKRELTPDSAPSRYETRVINKEGNILTTEITVNKILGTNEYVTSVIDLTEQKEAQQKISDTKNFYENIIERINEEIWVSNENNVIVYVNEGNLKIAGAKRGESLGMNVLNDFPEDLTSAFVPYYVEARKTLNPVHYPPLRVKTHDGRVTYQTGWLIPLEVDGEFKSMICTITDDTDRQKAENKIKDSLMEKEILLREIHHRVKNNLQIISSLLNLQTQYVEGEETVNVLKESQGRVKAMSMVHEKLYQSPNLKDINFKNYINQLVSDLFYSYGVELGSVEKQINVEELSIGIDTAIPCGLIINELVTNSLKYAFPDGKGKIIVELKPIHDKIKLVISDNGIGLPEEVSAGKTETLGLQLVNNLVNQLDGTLKIGRKHGTKFTIIFKELNYKERI
ncbi:MAG: PAS domain S-box [Methanobacterium sp. Maddingley MBC34]|nr:MAG: PAS domain S-box [Methanobacterium sp. Maddingley MBC34]